MSGNHSKSRRHFKLTAFTLLAGLLLAFLVFPGSPASVAQDNNQLPPPSAAPRPAEDAPANPAALPDKCDPTKTQAPPWIDQAGELPSSRHYQEWLSTTATVCTNILDENIKKYNYIINPQTNQREGSGGHTVGWTPGVHTLYRNDGRPPEVAFQTGFLPYNVNQDSNLRLEPGFNVKSSGLVSTTWSADQARVYGHPYIYVVRAAGGWYRQDDAGEREVAFAGGIRKERIAGALVLKDGKWDWQENPNFVDPEGILSTNPFMGKGNGNFSDVANDDPVYRIPKFTQDGYVPVWSAVNIPGWTYNEASAKGSRNTASLQQGWTPPQPVMTGSVLRPPGDELSNAVRLYAKGAEPNYLTQTMKTVPGTRYKLTYQISDDPFSSGTASGGKMTRILDGPFWNGGSTDKVIAQKVLPTQTLPKSTDKTAIQWTPQTVTFTARSALTTVSLKRLTGSSGGILMTNFNLKADEGGQRCVVTEPLAVANGSFAQPNIGDDAYRRGEPGNILGTTDETGVNGWKVLPSERSGDYWGLVDIYGRRTAQLPDKGQALSLNGGVGAISQVLQTNPGSTVTVTFKASRDTWSGVPRDMIQAFHAQIGKDPATRSTYILGTAASASYERPPTPPPNSLGDWNETAEWKDYSYTFTAKGNDELRFLAGNFSDAGPLLTQVTATETFETSC